MAIVDDCLCGTGLNNTGFPNCVKAFKKTTGLFYVPIYDNDGNRNSLDLSTTIDILAKTQATDPSQRWYPITELKDVELPTADSRFETAKDGSQFKLANGIKSFTGTIFKSGSMFTSKLQGVSCQRVGVALFDIDGNTRGTKEGSLLYPIEIGGHDAVFMDATDDIVAKTMIKFDFDILLKISSYWQLSATDIGQNPNTLTGLIDANLANGAITATTFVVTITTDYGSGLDSQLSPVEGLVTADFDGNNLTTPATVAMTSVESSLVPGEYTLTFAAQTAADVVQVNVLPISGFEGKTTFVAV
jgi:hypothetical protein